MRYREFAGKPIVLLRIATSECAKKLSELRFVSALFDVSWLPWESGELLESPQLHLKKLEMKWTGPEMERDLRPLSDRQALLKIKKNR